MSDSDPVNPPRSLNDTRTGKLATDPAAAAERELRQALDDATRNLGMFPPTTPVEELPKGLIDREADRTAAMRRGRYPRPADDRIGRINLVDSDDVLSWQDANVAAPPYLPMAAAEFRPGGARQRHPYELRRGFWPSFRPRGKIIEQYKFEKLEPNQIGSFLQTLDQKLTPNPGLKQWTRGTLSPNAFPAPGKRILLIVHGTFSHASNILQQFEGFPCGLQFLEWARDNYDQILAFDHPTLSVSPLLNALDLQRLFENCPPETIVDVICHSRGGLVTRWWIEAFGGRKFVRKAVFVASPLAGTSLAAPPRLKASLDLMTNIGRIVGGVAGAATVAVPFLGLAAGLMKIVTSVTGAVANSPLLDAAVAMIPGLACQSRVGNNLELTRLRSGARENLPEYFAISGSFQPDNDIGLKVWRLFSDLGNRATALGAGLVFRCANDLVVDENSMNQLFGDPVIGDPVIGAEEPKQSLTITYPDHAFRFDPGSKVWHTNYFQQPETIHKLAEWLKRPSTPMQ